MKLTEKKPSAAKHVLLFGPPKTGKTQLAGALAEHFNLLYFDLENGHETLFKMPEAWQDRIELISIPDTRAFPMAIETMIKVVKQPVDICDAHGKRSCPRCKKDGAPEVHVDVNSLGLDTIVVIDSLTQLTNSTLAHITKAQPDDYKPTFHDWARQGGMLDMFLSFIQVAPYHVVCITHEVEAETEEGKNIIFPVAGTRNFSRNSGKYFGEVIYATIKNGRHMFASSTTYQQNIRTGSRSDVVMENAANPSLLSIFKPEAYEPGVIPVSKGSASPDAGSVASLLAKVKSNQP